MHPDSKIILFTFLYLGCLLMFGAGILSLILSGAERGFFQTIMFGLGSLICYQHLKDAIKRS